MQNVSAKSNYDFSQQHLTPMITSPNSSEKQVSKRSLDAAARFKTEQASSFGSSVLGHGSMAFLGRHDRVPCSRIAPGLQQPNWKVPATYFPLFKNDPTKAPRKIARCFGQMESTFAPKRIKPLEHANSPIRNPVPRIPKPAEAAEVPHAPPAPTRRGRVEIPCPQFPVEALRRSPDSSGSPLHRPKST